jgi:BirA family biotin operon repressor/biotin-[acetyl-CoA-carboxylase] ligase
MFDLATLEAELAGTLFAGKLHFTRVTGSTNSDALAAARRGVPHGSVYFADEQLTGRGRAHHGWISAAGEGLYVSILLRPPFPASRLPLLPLAAGLAASQAIRTVSGPAPSRSLIPSPGLEIDLRWPNDLLIGPRKTGGILVESQTEPAQNKTARTGGVGAGSVAFAVIGIGINVHQRIFPRGLATPATSLDLELGKQLSRQTLLVALLKSLQREASALADPAAAATIPARVEQASTWARGRSVLVHGPQSCQGVTAGLDENGFLRVATAEGLITVRTGGLRAAEKG